jgi:hypothetical protein
LHFAGRGSVSLRAAAAHGDAGVVGKVSGDASRKDLYA